MPIRRLMLSMLGASAVVLLWTPSTPAEQTGKTPVRVSGVRLSEWLSHDFSFAGIIHANSCVFLITGPAQNRTQFLSCPDGRTETLTGVQRVEGDVMCATFAGLRAPNLCREWYEIGQNKFELKPKGRGDVTHTVYKLR